MGSASLIEKAPYFPMVITLNGQILPRSRSHSGLRSRLRLAVKGQGGNLIS